MLHKAFAQWMSWLLLNEGKQFEFISSITAISAR